MKGYETSQAALFSNILNIELFRSFRSFVLVFAPWSVPEPTI